ncbi:4-amino-4-deoxychorismate lyase [Portibacter lacus]|uniref:4-amino-4-deoxychorismate lyase n=2 Tax=Portibacter lacus TaxID=1099794 RepID=A0AA37STF9_9BACT|nr:4-amino-4-deoxychorismate lyase [Portibacter lacus]
MNRVRNRHFHEIRDIDLRDFIYVPDEFQDGIVKCRVVYGRLIQEITFEKYHFRNPRTFKLVNANEISYSEKSLDRSALDSLYNMREEADDIIIVKDNFITDSYYANLAFLQNGRWYTPAKPLLEGTFRAKLIKEGKIIPRSIKAEDISDFSKLKIFNALTEWEMHDPVLISRNQDH